MELRNTEEGRELGGRGALSRSADGQASSAAVSGVLEQLPTTQARPPSCIPSGVCLHGVSVCLWEEGEEEEVRGEEGYGTGCWEGPFPPGWRSFTLCREVCLSGTSLLGVLLPR